MPNHTKIYWQYDPLFHETKQVTLKELSYLYDMTKNNLHICIHRGQMIKGFNVMIFNHKPTRQDKQKANELIKIKDEVWRYYESLDICVSNYGRFKMRHKANWVFKIVNDKSNTLYIMDNQKHRYRASDIVYETFIGKINDSCHAYPKNLIYNHINADNLQQLSKKDYMKRITPYHHNKEVVILDKDGRITARYRSALETAKHQFCDPSVISDRCINQKHIDGLTYMYREDYELQFDKIG